MEPGARGAVPVGQPVVCGQLLLDGTPRARRLVERLFALGLPLLAADARRVLVFCRKQQLFVLGQYAAPEGARATKRSPHAAECRLALMQQLAYQNGLLYHGGQLYTPAGARVEVELESEGAGQRVRVGAARYRVCAGGPPEGCGQAGGALFDQLVRQTIPPVPGRGARGGLALRFPQFRTLEALRDEAGRQPQARPGRRVSFSESVSLLHSGELEPLDDLGKGTRCVVREPAVWGLGRGHCEGVLEQFVAGLLEAAGR